jgi:two-component system phosphate regulon response regulator PhoB
VNGSQAMHMISQEMPDVILLDVMMPSMTGIEVCRQIRAQFHAPSPYILMYTADNRDEVRARCMAAGANAFIPKETSIFELSQKVEAYLTDDGNHQGT